MNAILAVLSGPAWQHLALALLHTLWQGLAAGALLWLLLRRIPAERPETRYWTAFAVLIGLVFCGLTTWSLLDYRWPAEQASAETPADRPALAAAATGDTLPAFAEVDRPAGLPAAENVQAEKRPFWFALLIATWLAGVVVMTARMAWMIGRSRRLARGTEITDGRIHEMVEKLRQSLRVTRRLRIVEAAEDLGPAVLGTVRPVLLMPLSMLSGLPPDALHAIFAHELAHVRRHDYLWNLLQMAIEAVLFFNPAVWWINRQIRIEREACCDAMAAGVLGRPLELAEALSLWADRVFERNVVAAAFADGGRQGPRLLLDRVRRILLPGYRPQLPVSPVGFLGFLAATVAVLGGMSFGTSAMVDLAARILTPAERMERIVQTQQQYTLPENILPQDPEGKVTLSGKIRTRGGEAPPKHICVDRTTRSGISNESVYEGVQSPEFSITTGVGKTWLQFETEDYAPAIVGPFRGKAGDTISNIEVVLDRGFPLTIRVMDEKGKPVEGASVSGIPIIDRAGASSRMKPPVTDAQGATTILHAAERNYSFSVQRAGFQPLSSIERPVKPGQPIALTLTHAQPIRGIVLSSDGRPVAGAEIRQYAKFASPGGMMWGESGPIAAATDAEGRFVLDQLEEDATYALLVVTKDQGQHLVRDVSTKKNDVHIKIGPEIILSGTIRGDLGLLTEGDGKPTIRYRQSVLFPNHQYENSTGGQATVEPVEGGGKFTLRNLLPGKVTITAGEQVVHATIDASTPHQDVSIDLTKSGEKFGKRQVVIRFATPDGAVSPEGTMEVSVLERMHDQAVYSKTIAVNHGEARFESFTPSPLFYKPKGLLGYWFEEVYTGRIEPGKEPLIITVPVVPAGAIAGRILDVQGNPATENVSVSVCGELHSPGSTRSGSFGQDNITPDAKGRFFLSPLPLDGTFTVKATSGHNVQLASPVQLDAAQPTTKLTLRLPATTVAEGIVLDPDGRPMPRFPLEVSFTPPANQSYGGGSWSGNLATDHAGRFRIADLGMGVGRYAVYHNCKRDFRPMRAPLPLNGKRVTVRLERGLGFEGQVLDDAAERPLAGVEMYAMPVDWKEGDFICDAEALTDKDGKFRFSNLEDRPYRISTRSGLRLVPADERNWKPGEKSIVLRAQVPENSPLKQSAKP